MALFTKDRSFYRSLILLAVPISLQNLVTFAVNFADNVMIGSLGDDAISGVYVGGQLQSVVQMFVGGIEGAILILAAQYWGRKDRDSIRKVVSIGVKFALGVGLFTTLVAVLFPQWVIRIFTTEPGVIREGAAYVQIVGFTYLFFSVSQVMIAAMRSVETARIGLYISCMALVVNVCLNYVFIFGHLGFPAMGVRGAAVATLISRIMEMCVSIGYVFLWIKSSALDGGIFSIRMASFCGILSAMACPLSAGRWCGRSIPWPTPRFWGITARGSSRRPASRGCSTTWSTFG